MIVRLINIAGAESEQTADGDLILYILGPNVKEDFLCWLGHIPSIQGQLKIIVLTTKPHFPFIIHIPMNIKDIIAS